MFQTRKTNYKHKNPAIHSRDFLLGKKRGVVCLSLLLSESDSIGKPSSVVYGHLSSPAVAGRIEPPFNEARRADALLPAPIGVASDRVYTAAQSPALR